MGTEPVGKLVFRMSTPMMASMLFQALYNIVDSVFVARLSQDAMNAVSLAFPFQTLLIAFATGTGVGMNALLSRYLGEKNREQVNRTAGTGAVLFSLNILVFAILGWTMAGPFYRFQTSNPQILSYGEAYIHVCIGCCAGIFGQIYFERLLQSTGRTDLAMVSQILGAVCNIILDPIMIFGLFGLPKLEVKGAAIATVIGQCVACVVGSLLNQKKNPEIKLEKKNLRLNGEIVSKIYEVGIPSIVMQSIGSVMNFFLNNILIGFTEAATAVFGAYYKVQSFIFMPVFGLNNAMVPILSYNYGARKKSRIKRTILICIVTAMVIMTVGMILFETIPDTLLGFFSPSDEMLNVGRVAFRIIGIHFPIAGFCIVVGSVCQALGKPQYSLITSICRQLVVLLPAAWLLSKTGVLDNVWLAFPIAEIVSAIMNILFIRSTIHSLENLPDTVE